MLEAVDKGGLLGRARVLELAGRPRSGKLTGWIRPMRRTITALKAEGVVAHDAVDPLIAMYDELGDHSACYGYRVPAQLVALLVTDGS